MGRRRESSDRGMCRLERLRCGSHLLVERFELQKQTQHLKTEGDAQRGPAHGRGLRAADVGLELETKLARDLAERAPCGVRFGFANP